MPTSDSRTIAFRATSRWLERNERKNYDPIWSRIHNYIRRGLPLYTTTSWPTQNTDGSWSDVKHHDDEPAIWFDV